MVSRPSSSAPWGDLGRRLAYGLLVGVATWYAVMVPIAWTGTWVSNLIPSLQMFIQWFHVYLLVGIWAATGSAKATMIAALVIAVLVFVVVFFFLNGDPGLGFLAR